MAKDTWHMLRSYLQGIVQEIPVRNSLTLERTTEPYVMVGASTTATNVLTQTGMEPEFGENPKNSASKGIKNSYSRRLYGTVGLQSRSENLLAFHP